MVSRDYEELFKCLNAHKIKYLVIGAHAVIFYTEPRFTKDLDIWIPSDLNDPQRVFQALQQFGAPLQEISVKDFADKKMILQIGVAPIRVDLLMGLKGVDSQKAWRNRVRSRYGKTPISILGIKELIQAKKKAGRPQDLLDLENLTRKPKRKKQSR